MAPRLVELYCARKPTGSTYLHCDPTASHHPKPLVDSVFGRANFRNEIVWCYRGSGVTKNAFARKHDVTLFYAKTKVAIGVPISMKSLTKSMCTMTKPPQPEVTDHAS